MKKCSKMILDVTNRSGAVSFARIPILRTIRPFWSDLEPIWSLPRLGRTLADFGYGKKITRRCWLRQPRSSLGTWALFLCFGKGQQTILHGFLSKQHHISTWEPRELPSKIGFGQAVTIKSNVSFNSIQTLLFEISSRDSKVGVGCCLDRKHAGRPAILYCILREARRCSEKHPIYHNLHHLGGDTFFCLFHFG